MGTGRANGVGQAVDTVAHVGHQGGRVAIVPALPIAYGGEAGHQVVVGIDDEAGGRGGRAGIPAVVVGVQGEAHDLVGGAGENPTVLGRVGVAPVTALYHFPFVAVGGGYGVFQGVDTVAGNQVPTSAVVVHGVAGVVPALEGAGHAPQGVAFSPGRGGSSDGQRSGGWGWGGSGPGRGGSRA